MEEASEEASNHQSGLLADESQPLASKNQEEVSEATLNQPRHPEGPMLPKSEENRANPSPNSSVVSAKGSKKLQSTSQPRQKPASDSNSKKKAKPQEKSKPEPTKHERNSSKPKETTPKKRPQEPSAPKSTKTSSQPSSKIIKAFRLLTQAIDKVNKAQKQHLMDHLKRRQQTRSGRGTSSPNNLKRAEKSKEAKVLTNGSGQTDSSRRLPPVLDRLGVRNSLLIKSELLPVRQAKKMANVLQSTPRSDPNKTGKESSLSPRSRPQPIHRKPFLMVERVFARRR